MEGQLGQITGRSELRFGCFPGQDKALFGVWFWTQLYRTRDLGVNEKIICFPCMDRREQEQGELWEVLLRVFPNKKQRGSVLSEKGYFSRQSVNLIELEFILAEDSVQNRSLRSETFFFFSVKC